MDIAEYLTSAQAAKLTDYAPEGIRSLAQCGKLPFVKVGRDRLFHRADVLALRPRDPRGRKRKKLLVPLDNKP